MGIFSRKKKKEPEEVKKVASVKDEKKKGEKVKISSVKTDKKVEKKKKEEKKEIKKDQKDKKEDLIIRKSSSHLEYVIKSPHITEKSTDLSSLGQYVFKVADFANKEQIKKAINNIYNVEVDKVRIIKIPPKKRRFRTKIGKKSGYKKAIVKLKKGYSIEIIPGAGTGAEGGKK